ncbi:MAG: peptide deformylase, partial [Phototrophicales bacterium]
IVANPDIVKASKNIVEGVEGCLSIPGYYGAVDRPDKVTVKGFDRHGKPMRIKADGWLARIFQHEIDHLNGQLFIDIANKVWEARPEDEDADGEETTADES